MALGALIIKEKCKFSDEEMVQHITEKFDFKIRNIFPINCLFVIP